MRPRFSIRALLILISFASVACYGVFVRPTIFANRFSTAVLAKEFARAESLFCDASNHVLTESIDDDRAYRVEVKQSSRRWRDPWKMQKTVSVRFIPDAPQPGATLRVALAVDVAATPYGNKHGKPYYVTFGG